MQVYNLETTDNTHINFFSVVKNFQNFEQPIAWPYIDKYLGEIVRSAAGLCGPVSNLGCMQQTGLDIMSFSRP